MLSGQRKYLGEIVNAGRRAAFRVSGAIEGAGCPMTPPVHTAQNESRIIHSPWLGEIESDPVSELLFPVRLARLRRTPPHDSRRDPGATAAGLSAESRMRRNLLCGAAGLRHRSRISTSAHPKRNASLLQLPEDCDPVIGADVLCLALLRKSRPYGRGESECAGRDQSAQPTRHAVRASGRASRPVSGSARKRHGGAQC